MLSLALAAPKVVGGIDAQPGDWPEVVALFNGPEYICAGTLVTPTHVLSAAHCVGLVDRAVLGTLDRTDGIERDVIGFFEHPDPASTYDIALFELDAPVHSVPVRALALDCLADLILPTTSVTVAGWGFIDNIATEPTTLLKQVDVPIHDATCADLDRGCRSAVSPGGELVAGGDGLDSCTGDSGGPAYLQTPRGWVLAATVARAALPSTQVCGSGGIYVRVDAVSDWIESITGVPLERPDCDGLNRPPAPTAPLTELVQGETVTLQIEPNDPDDDSHTLTLISPSRGAVDGTTYTANAFQLGAETLRFQVTDDGTPPLSDFVDVEIRVFPAGHLPHDAPRAKNPGCQTLPALSAGWMLLTLCCTRRRPRHRHPAGR